MEEYKIRINESGEVSSEKEMSDRERESKLAHILELINDPDTPPGSDQEIDRSRNRDCEHAHDQVRQ